MINNASANKGTSKGSFCHHDIPRSVRKATERQIQAFVKQGIESYFPTPVKNALFSLWDSKPEGTCGQPSMKENYQRVKVTEFVEEARESVNGVKDTFSKYFP